MKKLSYGSVKLSIILKMQLQYRNTYLAYTKKNKNKKELLSIKVPLIIKNNCYERGNR